MELFHGIVSFWISILLLSLTTFRFLVLATVFQLLQLIYSLKKSLKYNHHLCKTLFLHIISNPLLILLITIDFYDNWYRIFKYNCTIF